MRSRSQREIHIFTRSSATSTFCWDERAWPGFRRRTLGRTPREESESVASTGRGSKPVAGRRFPIDGERTAYPANCLLRRRMCMRKGEKVQRRGLKSCVYFPGHETTLDRHHSVAL